MSYRLTFSLASLTLIFALAFVAMPAMAADGGPTVSITEYAGKNADDPAVDHVQTRTDFRLKVAFSHLVTGFAAEDVMVQTAASTTSLLTDITSSATVTLLGTTGAAGVPAAELTNNKVFVIGFTLADTDFAAGYLAVTIAANGANGAEAAVNGLGNQRGSFTTSSLPKANKWTLTPELDGDSVKQLADGTTGDDFDDDGKILATAEFTVNIMASNGPSGESFPIPPANQIQVKDNSGMDVPSASYTATRASAYVADKLPVTIAFSAVTNAPIFVGVNPNWAGTAGTPVRIPMAAAPTPPAKTAVNPVVDISPVGTIDEAAMTFEVKFTFTEATVDTATQTAAPVPTDLMASNITIEKEDPSDPTMMVASLAYVEPNGIIALPNSSWLVTINYRLDALPLYVGTSIPVSATTIGGVASTADDPSLMVSKPATAPGAPTGVTATADQAADTIEISWMAPASDGGSAITGYTITQSGQAAMTYTAAATATSHTTGALAAGDYSFTVMATNSVGNSSASAAATATIDMDMVGTTNTDPVVMITTTAPTTAQTGSFAISYTATDADAGDTVTVTAALNAGAPTGYSVVVDSTANTATIMQAKGSAATTVAVTITATDSAGATGSASISVKFRDRPADRPLVRPGAPVLSAVAGDKRVTLNWTTPTGDIASYQYSMNDTLSWMDVPNSNAATTSYVVRTHADGTTALSNGQTYTFVVRAINAEHHGPASNEIARTPTAAPPPAGDTTKPTVTISAAPDPINCDTGSTLTFTFSEALGANEAVAASELTVSKGWKAVAEGGAVKLVPAEDGSEIGVTTVTVSVKANAVRDAAGNANAKSTDKTFTVGPVLTIPAGGYIVVIRPEHRLSTHLRDPLYLGSVGVRGLPIDIQEWECMPDLTTFFGRSGAGLGGGALVIKQSPAHTGAAIGKGTVGISEIMWASDEGTIHGLTSNTNQAREQWIELHNVNSHEVKVTLFARLTNTALVTENDEIDRMSNYNIGGAWVVKGQNGDSALGKDFVSIDRGRGTTNEVPSAGKNYSHGHFNGKAAGNWNASTLIYRTRGSTLAARGATNPTYSFKGTPGRSNRIVAAGPPTRTGISKKVVFNEIANRRDQTLEWIELKNVSNGEVNLRNYHISYVDGVSSEKAFYTFPNNDNTKIPAGGLLLLVDTDPRYNDDHPVAVGRNIHTGNDQALGIGADAPRYMVANFAEGGLPDSGEFVLFLRHPEAHDKAGTAEAKRGTPDRMVDAAGYHPNLKSDGSPLYTNLWPLKVFGAPHSHNKIELEKVHYRQHVIDPDKWTHNDRKPEHLALRDVGYTGVGYKRHAHGIAAHGGSPGYEHGTQKNLASEIRGTGLVTISEIMFDQGDARYPQWIELYNSSPTQPVNLRGGKTGWKLVIENFDDGEIPVNRLSGTLNFRDTGTGGVHTILPQQTVIVASTRARNSGSAFFDTAVVFPPTRVFSVWDDARGQFGQQRSTDPILSTKGFYIELIDGGNDDKPNGYVSDSVGNLVTSPNRRVAHDKAWELSDITGEMMDDMGRSSILRRYRKADNRRTEYTAAELMDLGIMAEGWIAAHKTDFRNVRETWFGHPDDYGSPGITGGRVLPVSLSKFRPERLDDGTIVVRWITESETNNAGFNILRSETRYGEFTKLNTKLIAGKGTTSERSGYEFVDTSAKPNVVYYYQIQDVSLDGKVSALKVTHLRGHVSAAGKATTTWGELKALQ